MQYSHGCYSDSHSSWLHEFCPYRHFVIFVDANVPENDPLSGFNTAQQLRVKVGSMLNAGIKHDKTR